MREISTEYFMDEVRDGFFVPGMMKRSWAMSMKNFELLTEKCDELEAGINICFGGMIGAVRYGGWVPWDDDIDTEMLRRDYDRLKDDSDKGRLPENHRLVDYTGMDNGNLVRKWMDAADVLKSEERWDEDHGFPFVNNVDIFIMDPIPDSDKDSQYFRDVIDLCQHVKYFADSIEKGEVIDEEEFSYSLDLLQRVLKTRYDQSRDGKLSLWSWRVMEDFLKRYEKTATKDVGMIIYYMNNLSCKYPMWYYDFYVEMPFEYGSVRLPIGYDGILRTYYGNYMYPKVEYSGHFYPNYKMLEQISMEEYGISLLGYSYDEKQIRKLRDEYLARKDAAADDGICRVLFLVRKPEYWSTLSSLWKEACNDGDTEVRVVALPYFYRDARGEVDPNGMIVETDGYPDEVVLTPYDEYSLEDERPDIVVFQEPYDEYHDSYMVHPDFFVKRLRIFADKLVFISPFLLHEIAPENKRSRITLGFYMKNIGQALADRIYAQSENMKEVYVEILSGMSPDIDWSARVSGIGVPGIDRDDGRIRMADEHGYVLLYHINISVLYEHGEKVLERGRQLLKLIEDRSAGLTDACRDHAAGAANGDKASVLYLCYVEDPNIRKVLPEKNSRLWRSYEMFYKELEEHPRVIIDDLHDYRMSALGCDGYFGDGSVYMNAVRELKKPVLWQTPWLKIEKKGRESGEWDPDRKVMTEGDWDVRHFIDQMICVTDMGRDERAAGRSDTYGEMIWRDIRDDLMSSDNGMETDKKNRDREALLDEVRDGFLVLSMMKKQWAINLDDVDNLTGVCSDNGIKVFAGWGTLLGAIRHGGFIPWDDDVDTEMLRQDYERLLSVAGREEKEGSYHIDDFTTVGNTNTVRRWIEKSTLLYEPERWSDRHGFPLGNAIDIFILDAIPQDERYDEYKRVIYLCETARQKLMAAGEDRELSMVRSELDELKKITGLSVSDDVDTLPEVQVFELLDEYMKALSLDADKKAAADTMIGNAALFVRLGSCLFPRSVFKDHIWVDFEDTQIPVPYGYDRILRQQFGNYMDPVRLSYSHSYPAYDMLRDELKEKYDFEFLHYEFAKDDYLKIWNDRSEKRELKEKITENTGLLAEAHAYIRLVLPGGDGSASSWDEARSLLVQCQELAIQTGELIEKSGKTVDAVQILERYCDLVFRLYDAMRGGTTLSGDAINSYLQELSCFEEEFCGEKFTEIEEKKEVVFLVDKTGNWNSLHTIWEEAVADPDVHVTVIAVPYQFKDAMGMPSGDWEVDTTGIPENVELTPFDAYDLEYRHPDVVIYQDPYDEYSDVISVHPVFYASNLRKYTEKMVFIPPFTLTEIAENDTRSRYTLGIFIRNPGPVYADMILVQSEGMKQEYISILSDMTRDDQYGEQVEPELIGEELSDHKDDDQKDGKCLIDWEKRITGAGSALSDYESGNKSREYLMRRAASKESMVLFYLSGSMLYDNGLGTFELKIDTYKYIKSRGVNVSVYPDPYAEEILKESMPEVWEAYEGFVRECAINGDLVSDRSGDPARGSDKDGDAQSEKYVKQGRFLSGAEKREYITKLVNNFDAFYGDGGRIMNEFRLQGKPCYFEQPDKSYIEEELDGFVESIFDSLKEPEVTEFGKGMWRIIRS